MIDCLEIAGNFLLCRFDDLLFLAINERFYLCRSLHCAVEPIDACDVRAKIEAQRRIDAQKSRNRDGMLVIDQKRMLLRWTAVLHDFDLRTGHGSFDAGFDLLERFHG